MKNNKVTSAGFMGFWSVFWSMAGVSLAMSPDTSGIFGLVSGFSADAISHAFPVAGMTDSLARTIVLAFGVLNLAVGIGFALALYQDDELCVAVGLRACAAGAILALVLTFVGGATSPWALGVDLLLIGVIGASAVVLAMDKHQDMPIMELDPDRFEQALRLRMEQDAALERYYQQCRTSSQTSRASGSGMPIRTSTPAA